MKTSGFLVTQTSLTLYSDQEQGNIKLFCLYQEFCLTSTHAGPPRCSLLNRQISVERAETCDQCPTRSRNSSVHPRRDGLHSLGFHSLRVPRRSTFSGPKKLLSVTGAGRRPGLVAAHSTPKFRIESARWDAVRVRGSWRERAGWRWCFVCVRVCVCTF